MDIDIDAYNSIEDEKKIENKYIFLYSISSFGRDLMSSIYGFYLNA